MMVGAKTSQGIFLCQVKQPVSCKSVEASTESSSLLDLPTKRHQSHSEVLLGGGAAFGSWPPATTSSAL